MNSQQSKLSQEVSDFMNIFTQYIQENNSATVGEWLYMCGAMASTILSTQNLRKEELDDAFEYVTFVMKNVHERLPSATESNIAQ
jgi:hypothetical protein